MEETITVTLLGEKITASADMIDFIRFAMGFAEEGYENLGMTSYANKYRKAGDELTDQLEEIGYFDNDAE